MNSCPESPHPNKAHQFLPLTEVTRAAGSSALFFCQFCLAYVDDKTLHAIQTAEAVVSP